MRVFIFLFLALCTTSVVYGASTAMPTGNLNNWRLVFNEDFLTSVALGSFPGPYASRWGCYSGFSTTDKIGYYDQKKVMSVSGGMMDFYIHTDAVTGKPLSAAPYPLVNGQWGGTKFGRFSVRFRSDSLAGYKTAWLLWPGSGNWSEGEVDFPEGDLNGKINGYNHCIGNPSQNCGWVHTETTYTSWHIATIEWSPASLKFILDDVVVASMTTHIPQTAFQWIFQTETWYTKPSASVAGHIQIDWVAVWAYDTSASGPTAAPTVAPTRAATVAPSPKPCSGAWADSFSSIDTSRWVVADNLDWTTVLFKRSQIKAAAGLLFNVSTVGCPAACGGGNYLSGRLSSVSSFSDGTVEIKAQNTPYSSLWLFWETNSNRDGYEVTISANTISVQYYKNGGYNWGGSYTLSFDSSSSLNTYSIARTSTSFKVYANGVQAHSYSGANLPISSAPLALTVLTNSGLDESVDRTLITRVASVSYTPVSCL